MLSAKPSWVLLQKKKQEAANEEERTVMFANLIHDLLTILCLGHRQT